MYIFDLAFNPFAFLSLLAVAANGIVLYLVISEGLQISANRWFSYSVIAVIAWGITEAFSRMSVTANGAIFWETLGAIAWISVGAIFLAFTISYVGKEEVLSKISSQLILFGSTLFLVFLAWSTGLIVSHNPAIYHKVDYDWIGTLETPFFWLALGWIDLLFVISIGLLFRFWSTTKDLQRRKQTVFIIIGVLFPVVGGSITNGLLPIFGINIFKIAVPLTTMMSITVAYAIFRYKLFAISPGMVVSNIVETMNEILVVFNPDHYIEFVNSAVERVLGYKKEELTGQSIKKLAGSGWQNFENKVLKPIDEGKQVSGVEVNIESANGQAIPVSFSSSVLKNPKGEVYGEVGIATDIRETKDFITNLTAERNKLTTVMQSIVDGVLALDSFGHVILVNPAALTILGLEEKDILYRKLDEVLTMYDGNQKISCGDLLPNKQLTKDAVIAQKKALKIIAPSDRQIFINLTSSAIKEGSEVGLGAIITMSDVSKEKELEEMKIDFVSMAAHELRTPLTAVRGYLSVLLEESGKKLPKEEKDFVDKAFIASSQLAALVENLLSVSRIERGAMKLQIEAVDWSSIVKDSVNNFEPLAKEKKIKLTFELQENLPKVAVDQFRISEVLSNLIANALAYTKAGGSVDVLVETKGNEVITHVKDTGQGIPESALPRLFTKFFRVSGVLEQGSKGTGLGLYISKAIVDMHKGRIWVESKDGVGSTFSFSVPVAENTDKTDPIENKAKQSVEVTTTADGNKKEARFFKRKPA
jgi:PAS domain S-box-containing protein